MAAIRAFAFFSLVVSGVALADDQRALVNYQLHCQGCHLPDASGFTGKVPRMNNFVGYFLYSQEGREFLVRVPGVSASRLSDADVTEVMNWLLRTYSADQLPDDFQPFTESEVSALRRDRETDPETQRLRILRDIAVELPALAAELENPG